MKNELIPLSHDNVFYTIQGEGPSAGKPAIFVRTAYCNLKCSFCDSPYTWKSEYVNSLEKPFLNTWEEIYSSICALNTECKRVVITGGEPLMFEKELASLFYKLMENKYTIEIETNGTVMPSLGVYFQFPELFQFNVSPKLSNNSVDSKEKRVKPAVIAEFLKLKNAYFKFVIANKEDWEEVKSVFIKPFMIPKNKVYLMPKGAMSYELDENRHSVMELAKLNCVNYSDRLHILVYGLTRGV